MVDPVEVRVQAESQGEDVYDTHAAGIRKVNTAAKENIQAFRDARMETFQYRAALMGVNAAMNAFSAIALVAGVENEGLRKVLVAVNAAMAVANSLLVLHAVLQARAAAATWIRVAAMVAASGWGAPIMATIIAAAAAAVISTAGKSKVEPVKMAAGGEGIVTTPTLFIAGDRGPEAYRFVPLTGGNSMSRAIGQVNIYITTNDPDAAGRAVTQSIRRLKEAGISG